VTVRSQAIRLYALSPLGAFLVAAAHLYDTIIYASMPCSVRFHATHRTFIWDAAVLSVYMMDMRKICWREGLWKDCDLYWKAFAGIIQWNFADVV